MKKLRCSVQFAPYVLAMLGYVMYWFNSFLFMGLMMDLNEVIQPFKTVAWIFPFRFIFANFLYIEFVEADWTIAGAERCLEGGVVTPDNGCIYPKGTKVSDVGAVVGIGEGYSCGAVGSYSHRCFGLTGTEVLNSIYEMGFSIAETDNNVLRNLLLVVAMAVVSKIAHLHFFYKRTFAMNKLGDPKLTR